MYVYSLRYLEGDENAGKMGVRECVNHGLVAPYAVLAERPGMCVYDLFMVYDVYVMYIGLN